jgi:hypothetical protein
LWNEQEQKCFFKLDCDRLKESTQLMQFAAQPEKGMVRYVITYEKAK